MLQSPSGSNHNFSFQLPYLSPTTLCSSHTELLTFCGIHLSSAHMCPSPVQPCPDAQPPSPAGRPEETLLLLLQSSARSSLLGRPPRQSPAPPPRLHHTRPFCPSLTSQYERCLFTELFPPTGGTLFKDRHRDQFPCFIPSVWPGAKHSQVIREWFWSNGIKLS